jgi:3-methyl-2-oxobutanoate hydroxymethyltransferase
MPKKKRTIPDIVAMKAAGEKITMLTAYEVGLARMIDAAGIDVVLVGDSLGNVVLGYESTVPVTMAEMLHHARAVRRGVERALLVGDMPFMSYQTSPYDAVVNGGRFLKEAGCDAVKLEGGEEVCEQVRALVRAGIPVMGHIGLTPQTATSLGGYRVQGRDLESARRLLEAARALAEAGAFSVVLECVPAQLAELITAEISIPTIGIGAGSRCDGQVLVINDLLGLFEKFVPSFVKSYANLAPQIKTALTAYRDEVRAGVYPGPEHSFNLQDEVVEILKGRSAQ